MRRKTHEEFLEEFKQARGTDFKTDKILYKNTSTKITVICKKCNHEFQALPGNLVGKNSKCPKCSLLKSKQPRVGKEEFLKRVKLIHGNKYGYERLTFGDHKEKEKIYCRSCRKYFLQTRAKHLRGQGCKVCGNARNKNTLEDFIKRAVKIHGDKYDYKDVIYNRTDEKVTIHCPVHGKFEQTPHSHLKGVGCYDCGRVIAYNKIRKASVDFFKEAKEFHKGKYDYSISKYLGSMKKIEYICPVHGKMKQEARGHLRYGCEKCAQDKSRRPYEELLEEGRKIHEDRYIYPSKDYYKNFNTKVPIFCKEHKRWFWQRPSDHCRGNGCPICKESLGERAIRFFLEEKNIDYTKEFRIKKYLYRFDFYLPEYLTIIEYDGRQHFEAIDFFGGEEGLKSTKERDKKKDRLAKAHGLKVIRIPYHDKDNIADILNTKLNLKRPL